MTQDHSFFRRTILHVPRIAIVLIFLFVVFGVQISGGFDTARAQKLTDTSADSNDSETSTDDDFDLERCQRYCQGGPGGSNVLSGQLASCIQDCNDRAWKSYDKRMQRLK